MGSGVDAFHLLFSSMCALLEGLGATYGTTNNTRASAYIFPPKPQLFQQAGKQYVEAQTLARSISALAAMADMLLDSERLHCVGESEFFVERYVEAEESFRNAREVVQRCQGHVIGVIGIDDRLAPLMDLLRVLEVFYEVEVIECHAFLARAQGDWSVCQRCHEREIQLSEEGQQIAQNISPSLFRWFDGHVWYARKGLYECLANRHNSDGDAARRDEYLELAQAANAKAQAANDQFTGYQ